MSDIHPRADARERGRAVLDCLANALGCSPEAFSAPAPTDIGQTLELLNLWLGTEDRQARARALVTLRSATNRVRGKAVALAHAVQKPDRVDEIRSVG